MIVLKKINKVFNEKNNPLVIFKDFDLTLDSSKFITILGRSGSGKSTLLNIIGTIEKPNSGNVIIDDMDVLKLSDKELAKFRNEKIGYVFQSFFLETSLSVLDNVCLPLAIKGIKRKEREERAKKILNDLGLSNKCNEIISKLSGGEAQRVAIARALVNNPDIILADEPTGNLDYESGQEVMRILRKIVDDSKTVILVTHNKEDALKYSDIIYYLKDGKISLYDGE